MDAQSNTPSPSRYAQPKPLRPGYLLMPFGWAATPLAAMLEADRTLYPRLFTLSRERMHLVALALAHRPRAIDADFARLAITGTLQAVVEAVLGRRPAGLKRALQHLPVGVVPRHAYRQLIDLLAEPATAKLLHHADALTEEYLGLLHSIPPPLRRIAAAAIADLGVKPQGLADGLRVLAARGAAPTFDALVAELAAVTQPRQFLAHIGKLVAQLPLPDQLPPLTVGGARRLDGVADIRRLAKRWKNCLADCYISAVNEGWSAVYLWPDTHAPAVCVVRRHGRLGWALQEALGPENAALPPARLQEICTAFAAVGISQEAAVEAVESATHALSLSQRGIRRRRRPEAACEEMYDDSEAFETALAGEAVNDHG